MKKKIMLIDGNSIINRAYYGIKSATMLSTTAGIPTNAIFGFLNILYRYLEEEKPTHIAVAFDLKGPTFRHQEFESYKANRKGMDDELAVQFPYLKEVLDAMKISRVERQGFEADDILGTLSKKAENEGFEVILVTGDRDSMQLLSEKVRIKLPITRFGKTETEEYDDQTMFEKYGIHPDQLRDIKGLMGDSSDNIPGVTGIGEKSAYDLIKKFGTIEGIYENIDEVEKKGVKEKLIAGKEMAFLCKRLATIDRNVSLEASLEVYANSEPDKEKLYELLKKLEFNQYIQKLGLSQMAVKQVFSSCEVKTIKTISELHKIVESINNTDELCLYHFLEKKDSFNFALTGLAISTGEVYWIELLKAEEDLSQRNLMDENNLNDKQSESNISEELLLTILKPIFENESLKKNGYELKSLAVYLKRKGIALKNIDFDAMLAGYILDPTHDKHTMPQLAKQYLEIDLADAEEIISKKRTVKDLKDHELQDFTKAVGAYVGHMKEIKEALISKISENSQLELFNDVEMPLIEVLAEMEYKGFKVDLEGLKAFDRELSLGISSAENSIYMHAGEQFNISSPKQLGVILFEKLGLPPLKKTKTGYSTDAEVLEELSVKHDIVKEILLYRQLTKLKTTYAEGLMAVIDPMDGRIHSNFNQTITATGRISSTEPNLQNIPIRLELGRKIRKVFIPEDSNYVLCDADYSQIELRVLAHVANDEHMIDAFLNNLDIHTATASKVFKIDENEVTSLMRSRAKAVNFGIVYGIGDFSLAKDLGITKKEAKRYIDDYLENYSGVRKYMSDTVEFGKENGFVETLMHRRRYLPELASKNFNIRSFGERVAMNAPIQGSAADIIKIAMVNVHNELKEKCKKSSLILQVHDELVIETHKDEKEQVEQILKSCMENALKLKIPLTAEVKTGNTWYDTK